MEKVEPSYTAGGDVKWYILYTENILAVPRNVKH